MHLRFRQQRGAQFAARRCLGLRREFADAERAFRTVVERDPSRRTTTLLNLALALTENGVLQTYGVKLIGATIDAIRIAEDRNLFRETMLKAGLPVPRGGPVTNLAEAETMAGEAGYPLLVRASFALGGSGARGPASCVDRRLIMHSSPDRTALAVIGGGPGGYAAAFLAAELGL